MSEEQSGVTVSLETIYKTLMEVRDDQRDMKAVFNGHGLQFRLVWTLLTLMIASIVGVFYKGGS